MRTPIYPLSRKSVEAEGSLFILKVRLHRAGRCQSFRLTNNVELLPHGQGLRG